MRRSATQPSCSRLLRSFLNIEPSSAKAASATLPLYLCPAAAARPASTLSRRSSRRPVAKAREDRLLPLRQARRSHAQAIEEARDDGLASEADGAVEAPRIFVDVAVGETDGSVGPVEVHDEVTVDKVYLSVKSAEIDEEVPVFKIHVSAEPSAILEETTVEKTAAIGGSSQIRGEVSVQDTANFVKPTEIPKKVAVSKTDVFFEPISDPAEKAPIRQLPVQCHGCGALSQTTMRETAGYYDVSRKPVKVFLGLLKDEGQPLRQSADAIVQASLRSLSKEQLEELGIDVEALAPGEAKHDNARRQPAPTEPGAPLCDRCHKLVYHHTGTPIYHPTIEAIRDTLAESPYKYNHVYHVLDAADFPMSLLPKVHQLLDLMPLRTKNRRQRSSGGKFFKGRRTELSFIITRSDLLAPKKEAVDRMMPYLVETLRDALPRDSRHVRLGNVRCVSAKRSWWTKELKEDIWQRGGAGWMVGKVNVGKSQLFHEVFPKGRMGWNEKEPKHDISIAMQHKDYEGQQVEHTSVMRELDDLDEDALLPPAQEETNYPQMPVVSALPGTTASPIRVPFGGGKGELIDLPGLARSDLESMIREEHRPSLIMKARITPEQHVIKPGRSLLIGGFIRITPRTPDLIFLGYNFTPLEEHMCGTDKAIAIQTQTGEVRVENIALPATADRIKLAGSFPLKYDVTKRRAGPITRRDAVGMKVENLPYRVLSIDILIEGCGWVEITAQVRVRDLYKPLLNPGASSADLGGAETESLETMGLSVLEKPTRTTAKRANYAGGEEILQSLDLSDPNSRPRPSPRDRENRSQDRSSRARGREEPQQPRKPEDEELSWPVVDVYSPEGRFVGSRRPMNGWLLNQVRKTPQTSKQRPRKSMTGEKKREKQARRAN